MNRASTCCYIVFVLFFVLVVLCGCTKTQSLETQDSTESGHNADLDSTDWLRSLEAGMTRAEIMSNPRFDRFVRVSYRTPHSTEEIVAKDGFSILAVFRAGRYEFDGQDSLRAIDADGDRVIP